MFLSGKCYLDFCGDVSAHLPETLKKRLTSSVSAVHVLQYHEISRYLLTDPGLASLWVRNIWLAKKLQVQYTAAGATSDPPPDRCRFHAKTDPRRTHFTPGLGVRGTVPKKWMTNFLTPTKMECIQANTFLDSWNYSRIWNRIFQVSHPYQFSHSRWTGGTRTYRSAKLQSAVVGLSHVAWCLPRHVLHPQRLIVICFTPTF